jgi:hypothetical protein
MLTSASLLTLSAAIFPTEAKYSLNSLANFLWSFWYGFFWIFARQTPPNHLHIDLELSLYSSIWFQGHCWTLLLL